MNEFIVSIDLKTRQAIDELMTITGAENTNKVIQDSLRILEWLIYHQSKGHMIAALTKSAKVILENANLNTNIAALVNYIKPEKEQVAKDYFKDKKKK